MEYHLAQHRGGFPPGYTAIRELGGDDDAVGIGLGVLRLEQGAAYSLVTACETAWLLMSGDVSWQVDEGASARVQRGSLFDESPSCLHVAKGVRVRMVPHRDVELTVYQTHNDQPFAPRVYLPEDVPTEQRGKGQVGDTCHRQVRTIFDRTSADANAELVLGEVVTLPGRWSSYPPHHHPQPELYHYRFTAPQGFGFAQHGDEVVQVKQFDTVVISAGKDHAQAAAPGYGMYYSWVIRHLPGNPYTVPEFTPEHAWVMQPGASYWRPTGAE